MKTKIYLTLAMAASVLTLSGGVQAEKSLSSCQDMFNACIDHAQVAGEKACSDVCGNFKDDVAAQTACMTKCRESTIDIHVCKAGLNVCNTKN